MENEFGVFARRREILGALTTPQASQVFAQALQVALQRQVQGSPLQLPRLRRIEREEASLRVRSGSSRVVIHFR